MIVFLFYLNLSKEKKIHTIHSKLKFIISFAIKRPASILKRKKKKEKKES